MTEKTAQKIIKITAHGYDNIASSFSLSRNYIWPVMRFLKGQVKNGGRILDVGCGNGRLYELFAKGDYEYSGMDISEEMIKVATEKWGQFKGGPEFMVGNILKPEGFLKLKFDAVFIIAALNHIPSRKLQLKALKNVYNSLQPGGLLLMSNFNMWKLSFSQKSFLKYWKQKFFVSEKKWQRDFGFSKRDISAKDLMTCWKSNENKAFLYYRAFSKNELKKLLTDSGFTVKQNFYEYGGRPVPFWRAANIVSIAEKPK